MGKLTDIAKNVVGVEGEYTSINDLMKLYPGGVTINGVHQRDGKLLKAVPCFTFAEDANKYFYAVAGDLAKIYASWLENSGGSIVELNKNLGTENVKVTMEKVRTNNGNTYLKVKVLGSVENPQYEAVDPETGEILEAPF